MTSGLNSDYKQKINDISYDLSSIFPPYEILSLDLTTINTSYTFNLTRNKNNQTDYIVIPSIYSGTATEGNPSTFSDNISRPLVHSKNSTSFQVAIAGNTFTGFDLGTLWCLVIYSDSQSNALPLQNTLSFNNTNDTNSSLINNFPQYMTFLTKYSINTSTDAYVFSFDISIKGYTGNPLNYFLFSSYELTPNQSTTNVFNFAKSLDNVLFLTQSAYRTTTFFQGLFTSNYTQNFDLDFYVLTLFPSINNPNSSYNTNFNSVVNNSTLNLANIYPRCQYFSQNFSNDNSTITLNFTVNNTSGTTNYYIFPSYCYNLLEGSGGTYNGITASGASRTLIVSNKTATSFTVTFRKGTGDNWNGGVTCLVIFP